MLRLNNSSNQPLLVFDHSNNDQVLLFYSWIPVCLCLLPVVSTEKSLGPSPLQPLIRDFCTLIRSPQFFSRLNSHRSLSLMFNSWIISVAPHWAHALSSPALEQALQGWERGIITSPDMLPGLFLIQLVMFLDFIAARALCWLRIHFVSTQSFRSLSVEQLPSSWFPACPCAWIYSSPIAALCMSLPSSSFCLFLKPLWFPLCSSTINLLVCQPLLLNLCNLQPSCRCTLPHPPDH